MANARPAIQRVLHAYHQRDGEEFIDNGATARQMTALGFRNPQGEDYTSKEVSSALHGMCGSGRERPGYEVERNPRQKGQARCTCSGIPKIMKAGKEKESRKPVYDVDEDILARTREMMP
jgi:hypothetical protein